MVWVLHLRLVNVATGLTVAAILCCIVTSRLPIGNYNLLHYTWREPLLAFANRLSFSLILAAFSAWVLAGLAALIRLHRQHRKHLT